MNPNPGGEIKTNWKGAFTLCKKLYEGAPFTIKSLINDPKDSGFFRHYSERIETYYDESQKDVALLILDKACYRTIFWEEEEIINTVNSVNKTDEKCIKSTLELLWSDHYLLREIKNNKRFYKFRYSILQEWWKVNRG